MIIYIPARSGSKRIKDKNMAKLGGFSLINLAIIRGLESSSSKIVVSSDSDEYLCSLIRNERIIKYKRPSDFAKDETTICQSMINDISSLFENKYHGNICMIQPSNPFAKIEDLKNACGLYKKSPKGALVSVVELPYKGQEIFSYDNSNNVSQIIRKNNDPLMFIDGNFVITNFEFVSKEKVLWKFGNDFTPFFQKVDYTIDIDYPWMLNQAELLWNDWISKNDQDKYYSKY